MTSYESLADAAFAAAIDIQWQLEGKPAGLQNFSKFVRMLREPISENNSYKLLQDPRNVPLYKAAWRNVYGLATKEIKSELVMKEISDLLQQAEDNIASLDQVKVRQMAEFCLTLNSVFLEENGRSLNNAYVNRVQHASP